MSGGRRAARGSSGSTASIQPAGEPHITVFDRGFQLGDGIFETLRARAAAAPTELAEHLARLRRSAGGLDIELPPRSSGRVAPGSPTLLAAEGLDGPDGDASIRITVTPRRVGVPRAAAAARRPPRAHDRDPGVARGPAAAVAPRARPPPRRVAVRRDPANPIVTLKTTSRADYVFARLEARRAGADDALFLTTSGHLSESTTRERVPRPAGCGRDRELATPALDCAILPGTTRSWLLRWAAGVGLRAGRGLAPARRPRRGRRGVRVLVRRRRPARHALRRHPDRRRPARPVHAPRPRRPRGGSSPAAKRGP